MKIYAPEARRSRGLFPSASSHDSFRALDAKNDYNTAIRNTCATVGAAILFGAWVWWYKGQESGMAFMSGYMVEQSLSVDNLFVFMLLFNYFKVPVKYQNRVLSYGIYGAVLMRGVMIFIGVRAIERFQMVTLIFAGILMYSAYKLLTESDDEDDLESNTVMKISRYFIKCSKEFDDELFFTTEKGARLATPLFLCLVCVELSDFVFAIDSIPAVIGVTHDPFIVYTSNIFAIMGLRSLYTLVAKAISELPYLKSSVAMVLGFIGAKMLAEYFHYNVSTGVSLCVVLLLLLGGVVFSLVAKNNNSQVA
jgi:TerC family integral membrane protein